KDSPGKTSTWCCGRRSISSRGTSSLTAAPWCRRSFTTDTLFRSPMSFLSTLRTCFQPRLRPNDPYHRSKMRLWIKQLDEDVHDACAAILSFGIAFRHQYLERAELGKAMLERIPNIFKRERRRDVVENGTRSQHFVSAVQRMLQLLDEMEEALAEH